MHACKSARPYLCACTVRAHATSDEQLGLDVNVQRSREFLHELSRMRCITPWLHMGPPALGIKAAAAAG